MRVRERERRESRSVWVVLWVEEGKGGGLCPLPSSPRHSPPPPTHTLFLVELYSWCFLVRHSSQLFLFELTTPAGSTPPLFVFHSQIPLPIPPSALLPPPFTFFCPSLPPIICDPYTAAPLSAALQRRKRVSLGTESLLLESRNITSFVTNNTNKQLPSSPRPQKNTNQYL